MQNTLLALVAPTQLDVVPSTSSLNLQIVNLPGKTERFNSVLLTSVNMVCCSVFGVVTMVTETKTNNVLCKEGVKTQNINKFKMY